MKHTFWTILSVLLAAAMLLTIAACGKQEPAGSTDETTAAADNGGTTSPDNGEPTDAEQPSAEDEGLEATDGLTQEAFDAMTEDELREMFVKDMDNITPEEFIALAQTLRFSTIEDDDDSLMQLSSNAATKLLNPSAIRNKKPAPETYLPQLLASKYPQVRGYVMQDLYFSLSDENIQTIMDALKTETDPFVLYQACKFLAPKLAVQNADAKDFVFRMTESEYPKVRAQAAGLIGNRKAQGMPEYADKIIEMMKDESEVVREKACINAGDLNDDTVLDALVAILNDPAQSSLHDDCMRSLADMWLDNVYHDYANEKAYRATLDYLNKTPRSGNQPAFGTVSCLKSTAKDDQLAKWKEKATFFDENEFFAVLRDLVLDEAAGYNIRGDAINVIKSLCSAELFGSLRADLEKLDAGDIHNQWVMEAYEKAAQ